MSEPKEGEWLPLSSFLTETPDDQAEAAARAILLGKERVRYLRIDKLPRRTAARGYRDLSAPDEHAASRADFQDGPIPRVVLKHGRINWRFSTLTQGKFSIHHIEIFVPDVARGADAPMDQPKPRGRPPIGGKIKEEGRRLLQEGGRFETLADLARAVESQGGYGAIKTIRGHLTDIWHAHLHAINDLEQKSV
jgi:hypothetical protein